MTSKLKTSIMAFWVITAMTSFQSAAQQTKFSLEIDPVTFVAKGYSLHLRVQPKSSDHLLLGLGIYAMDMPAALVNFNKNNRDKGWNVRLDKGLGLFGEYHFAEVNRKWFVGAQAGLQEYKIDLEILEGSEQFSNLLFMGYAGYVFRPFKFNLYFKPWAGIGYTTKISDSNQLGSEVYDVAPITMFATLHIGYTF
ncbi:MAG: hypothetical protein KDC85_13440 [Saprospiraceae bacterium]|nr:hypothetical protein [Saprospiraceae bacterium]MCB9325240.1 hypothetical protein [Lewinellaceae bacterium]